MVDLGEWLETIGLGRHAQAFREHEITPDLLDQLSGDDLKELGLNLGDRKRMLKAIAALSAGAAPAPAPAVVHHHHAERRRLTVMFVDLVGSTALSSRLDPEELSEVIRAYQNVVAGIVTRYQGHIAQYLGDGVLCYFGWPRAMEDTAERAVGAALETVEAVKGVKTLGEPLACRIGIASGLVVVGDLIGEGAHEDTAIGDTPNLAARLQGFASSGQVVISESTRRLLGGSFAVESLGERSFKGIPGQHEIFAVTGSIAVQDRFDARTAGRIAEMIGREHELALLLDRWELSRAGEGQGVLLIGEAGIGKSRISRALFDAMPPETVRAVRFQCSPYHRDTALWPIIQQIIQDGNLARGSDNEARLDLLEAHLATAGITDPHEIALIGDLLGFRVEERYGAFDMPPSARRAATFGVVLDYIVGLSAGTSLLMLVEDTHWCDPTTLELLGMLLDRIRNERIMILMTSRPENEPDFPSHPHFTSLTLNRLGRVGVEKIVRHLGGGSLPPEAIDAIVERTDGVPLFVEELTKALLESGEMTVPASLHDTLMARLDRLPEVKEIAQIASVIGREFESDPLANVAELSQQKIMQALADLQRVELVFRRGSETGRYIFKHALVRDAAYESLLNRRRQEIHGRIFDVLRENEMTLPGVLANHAAEAGRLTEAVEYGRRAAEQALRRPAYAEALTHLETALGVLSTMPPSDDLKRERLLLLLLAGQARIAHYGYAADPTIATYAEVEEIAREIGDRKALIQGLYGRWAGRYVPGELATALTIADKIADEAKHADDDLVCALGYRLRGTCLTMMGRVEPATEALEGAHGYYDIERHAKLASRFGQDVGVARQCYLTGVLTLRGQFDSAARLAENVLADIERVDHTHTAGYGLGHIALFLSAADIQPLGLEVAEKCIALSEKNRMPLWAALGHGARCMGLVIEGRDAEALPEFRESLDTLANLRFDVFRPLLLPYFALALARTGDVPGAAAHIAEARNLVEQYDARFAEAEVLRVEGHIAQIQRNHIKAKACFEHALGRARDLGHRSWQLRTAEDLAEVLRGEEADDQAHVLLSSVYDEFTEGHTFPALKRIARLMEQVA